MPQTEACCIGRLSATAHGDRSLCAVAATKLKSVGTLAHRRPPSRGLNIHESQGAPHGLQASAARSPPIRQRPCMTQPAYLHLESDSVRFWVLVDATWVGAMISRRALHHRFQPQAVDEDPMQTYLTFEQDIHAAVRRRVAAGSLEPVMLREHDLRDALKT